MCNTGITLLPMIPPFLLLTPHICKTIITIILVAYPIYYYFNLTISSGPTTTLNCTTDCTDPSLDISLPVAGKVSHRPPLDILCMEKIVLTYNEDMKQHSCGH